LKKNLLKICLFILISILIFNEITYIFKNKEVTEKIGPIYEEEKLDVIFLGSSTTEYSIYPMQLWEEHGIVSYNAGHPGGHLEPMYYRVKEYIKKFSPKVIVIDCRRVDQEGFGGNSEKHYLFDNMKFSLEKIEMLTKLPLAESIEMMFNIVRYHSSWDTLTEDNFEKYGVSMDKGAFYGEIPSQDDYYAEYKRKYENLIKAEYLATLEPNEYLMMNKNEYNEMINTQETVEVKGSSLENIVRIAELCKKNNVKPLFVVYPNSKIDTKLIAWCIEEFSEQNNLEFINFYNVLGEIEFDARNDFADTHHLSVSGGKKITKYMGEYLINKGYVSDRRNDSDFAEWHEYYNDSEYKRLYSDKK